MDERRTDDEETEERMTKDGGGEKERMKKRKEMPITACSLWCPINRTPFDGRYDGASARSGESRSMMVSFCFCFCSCAVRQDSFGLLSIIQTKLFVRPPNFQLKPRSDF